MAFSRRASSFLDAREGPASLQELALWDIAFVKRLAMEGMAASVMDNLSRGLFVTSEFSGFDVPREATRIWTKALATELRVPEPAVWFVRSCDSGRVQKQCLMSQSDKLDGGSSCVFSDALDRLDPDVRDWVKAAGPTKDMPVQEAQEANGLVENFLAGKGAGIFSTDGLCYCEMHRQRCPVHVRPVLRSAMGMGAGSQPAAAPETFPSPSKRRRTGAVQRQPWHVKTLSELGPSEGQAQLPLSCSIAGLVCTDYTPLGRRRGHVGAGVTEPVHAVWCHERQHLATHGLEDFFFTENSSAYPVMKKQITPLATTHEIKYVVTCPYDLGFAMRRRRTFTFGCAGRF